MDCVPAPANPITAARKEEAEHGEKKPALKKVKEKVKKPVLKIKSAISKKSHGNGGHGDGDDHQHRDSAEGGDYRHGDLDEGDEGYKEDEEEVEEDPEVHGGVSAAEVHESGAETKLPVTGEHGGMGPETAAAGKTQSTVEPAGLGVSGDHGGLGPGREATGKSQSTVEPTGLGLGSKPPVTGEHGGSGPARETRAGDQQSTGESAGLGLITAELVEDLAAPGGRSEGAAGREEVVVSPELQQSFEAMTVSDEDGTGTAVVEKVKPETGKEGEGEGMGKKDKVVSVKEYLAEKLTPGEEDKALSAAITEAVQRRREGRSEVPAAKGSGDDGGREGVVGRIKKTISSVIGGGGLYSLASPAAEHVVKGDGNTEILQKGQELEAEIPPAAAEGAASSNNGGSSGLVEKITAIRVSSLFEGGGRPDSADHGVKGDGDTEAVQNRKTAEAEETVSGEGGENNGVVGKITETVSSFLGGGGRCSPASPAAAHGAKGSGSKPRCSYFRPFIKIRNSN
ncbi:hypothetical protein AXF42_Ash015834 [Apostasia shenzhenica]|uniref:LTI65/LTI78 PGEED repeat domain-containing protein n=1 Tax=Apostasia shenzhenica TaxID=1088818 RepID=A0A2H9ZXN9_9ASPA|nr:hypothetical protein AXF42_Ash015834 [Apostasia shenzhenica]